MVGGEFGRGLPHPCLFPWPRRHRPCKRRGVVYVVAGHRDDMMSLLRSSGDSSGSRCAACSGPDDGLPIQTGDLYRQVCLDFEGQLHLSRRRSPTPEPGIELASR